MKQTTQETIQLIEETINPNSPLGINIGILIAKLQYATRTGEAYAVALKSAYSSIGNDLMVNMTDESLEKFRQLTE